MKSFFLALLGLLTFANVLSAQSLSPEQRQNTIDATLKLLNEQYVFPAVAGQMEQSVRGRLRTYDTITNGHVLAHQLTKDLQAISHDRHLNVTYYPNGVPADQIWHSEPTPQEREAEQTALRRELPRDNFGIGDVSVLKGNLGYVNFKYLAPPEFAGETYTAVMNYLAHTDALIIDLRQCSGAISEHAIPFLCSYFFGQPTHLNDFYWRTGNRTVQSWTYAQVPGRSYGIKPLYVLTSRRTFSGAEGLAYFLKTLKRATLVGDTTRGGANPSGTLRINGNFTVHVPVGRATSPITKTNWEGVGVAPDTVVLANRALYTAQLIAYRNLLTQTHLDPDWREALRSLMAELANNPPRFAKHRFTLRGYAEAKDIRVAGTFNSWSKEANPLIRQGNVWVADVELEPGKASYKFIIDGQWTIDPANPRTEHEGRQINSVVNVAPLD
ncbi:S41 family peptidase [Spirosoma areae]